MRAHNDHPSKNGGWIHLLEKKADYIKPTIQKKKKDANRIACDCYAHPKAEIVRKNLALQLGVTCQSLEELVVGYGVDYDGSEWASFPSRGENGHITGVVRRYNNGLKKTVAGTSNAGVFCKQWWWIGNGTVYIVEGPSDVAAMLDAGLCVLGRPSNIGGTQVLTQYLKRRQPKRIVVIGENDEKPERRGEVDSCPKSCNGCSYCFPGAYGAIATASRLSKVLSQKVETIMPPNGYKDVREWWNGSQLKGLE